MSHYVVTYLHKVEITYEAIVEADSKEEAEKKMQELDFESETEIDHQGIEIEILDTTPWEETNE